MAIVLDASAAIAWAFKDERDAQAVAIAHYVAQESAIVPALWRWEVQNVLLNAEKRGRVKPSVVVDILNALAALPISVEPEGPDLKFAAELDVARRFGLSLYDSAYLELALRKGLLLATKDSQLAAAAKKAGALWNG